MKLSTASTRVADQFCVALGGGRTAPYTDQQVQAAADRLTPDQRLAGAAVPRDWPIDDVDQSDFLLGKSD